MLDIVMKVSLTLIAFDKMSKVIQGAVSKSEKSFDSMQKKIQNVSQSLDKIGKTAMVAGGVILTLSGTNLKMAADFETGMSSVSTLIDTNVESLDSMKKEVLEIGKRTPVALDGLTTSLYDIRSAGVSAENQFTVLEKSAQLGVAGLGSTSEAVDLVTSSLNAFQLKGKAADNVYDNIFKTAKFGKTTISGIAQGFGAVAGTVAAADIKLDDYLSAIAALTTTGQPASQAHTQIKAAISGMTRETKESVEVFHALGAKNFKDLIHKSGGMVEAFSRVAKQVKGNDAAILKLFGSTEAYNAVIGLTTNQHQTYVEALESMRNGPSLVDEAYEKKLNTVNAQLQRFQNFTQKISIDMGNALVPSFRKFLDCVEKVMTVFDSIPENIKNKLSVGLVGLGLALTTFGVAAVVIGKLVAGYGKFLQYARDLTPVLVKNSAAALENIGLNTTAHNLTYGYKIKSSGDKLGLASSFSLKNGLFADLKRIDNDMKKSIGAFFKSIPQNLADTAKTLTSSVTKIFKELPGNISKSAVALKNWTITSFKAIPENLILGLKNLKAAFLGIPGVIKNAIVAFIKFSVTLLTSPIGWIAVIITGAAFLIYKYWKPITGFFKGVWSGLKEGLKPLMPVFKQVSKAFEPVMKAIKPVIAWFKRLIKPVEDTGGAAEKMGVKFGKALANIILKLVELVKKVFDFGSKIGEMLSKGILSNLGKTKEAIGKHAQIIRDHLPHSPAKTGPLKDLHKVKIVETIAGTLKPAPLINAMNKTLGLVVSTPKNNFKKSSSSASSNLNTSSIVITYNPTITISGSESKEDFLKLLKKHKDEIVAIVKRETERKERLAY